MSSLDETSLDQAHQIACFTERFKLITTICYGRVYNIKAQVPVSTKVTKIGFACKYCHIWIKTHKNRVNSSRRLTRAHPPFQTFWMMFMHVKNVSDVCRPIRLTYTHKQSLLENGNKFVEELQKIPSAVSQLAYLMAAFLSSPQGVYLVQLETMFFDPALMEEIFKEVGFLQNERIQSEARTVTASGSELIKVMDTLIDLLRCHTSSNASSKRDELKDMWKMSIFNGIKPARTMVPTTRGVKKVAITFNGQMTGELTLCGPQDVYVQDDSLEDSSEGLEDSSEDVTMEDEIEQSFDCGEVADEQIFDSGEVASIDSNGEEDFGGFDCGEVPSIDSNGQEDIGGFGSGPRARNNTLNAVDNFVYELKQGKIKKIAYVCPEDNDYQGLTMDDISCLHENKLTIRYKQGKVARCYRIRVPKEVIIKKKEYICISFEGPSSKRWFLNPEAVRSYVYLSQ